MPHSKNLIFPFLLVFFEMVTYLSSDMYLPALPTVMKDFSLTHAQAQWTLTSWFLGAISVQLILGPLADRYGRKTILCFGGVLFTFSTLICAFATNVHIFLIARFIQGTGICFMAVPGYASIHESYDQKDAIKLLALMGSISVLAPAFGPLLGSAILLFLNWRWIFGFLVIWSALAVFLLMRKMPETLPPYKRHPLNFFTILQNYRRILCNFRFITTITVFGLLFCGFITWIAAGPFLIIDHFKQSPMAFGLYQTLIFISYIFSNYLVKKLIEQINIKKMIQFGLLICLVASSFFMMIAIWFPDFMWGMIITYIIYAFGSGFAFSPLNRLVVEATNEPMGSRMAIFSMLTSGFATLGSILVGLFYNGTLLSLAFILLAVAALSFILERLIDH